MPPPPERWSPPGRGSGPTEDILRLIPDAEADVAVLEEPEHLNWFHPASDNFWRSGPRWAPAPPPPRAGGRYSRKAVFGPSREGCQGLPGHGSFRGQFGPGPRPLGGNTLENSTARRTPPWWGERG